MAKSNKLLTSLVLGAVGGAAVAVFLASKTGKVVKSKVSRFVKDYQANPEAKHTEWADMATDLKHQATERYADVKHKFETGEVNKETIVNTVKEKAAGLKKVVQEDFFVKEEATADEGAQEVPLDEGEDVVVEGVVANTDSEDITIDLSEVADNSTHQADQEPDTKG